MSLEISGACHGKLTVKVIGAKVYKPVRKLEPAMESVIPEEAFGSFGDKGLRD